MRDGERKMRRQDARQRDGGDGSNCDESAHPAFHSRGTIGIDRGEAKSNAIEYQMQRLPNNSSN
jgi:hypothetical protein